MNQKTAPLRTCAACEWVFVKKGEDTTCPKCGFVSYGARFVYGNAAYRYARTQKPWKDRKMLNYEIGLNREIKQAQSNA